jgi:hypothetical protein
MTNLWAKRRAPDLTLAQYSTQRYCIDIDRESRETGVQFTLAELLTQPAIWINWVRDAKLKPGDLIRIIGANTDAMLCVRSIMPNAGAQMEIHGSRCKPGTELGNAIAAAEANVRREETEALFAKAQAGVAS